MGCREEGKREGRRKRRNRRERVRRARTWKREGETVSNEE